MMKLQRFLLIAWLLSICSCLSNAATVGISVNEIETSLREGDPRATLEKYFNCEKYEGSAFEAIAAGSSQWILLAEKMLQYSDACYTEGIQASLGTAMQKAPQNVLPLIDKTPTLAANRICLPFISNEISIKSQLAEISRSKKSIQEVRGPRFRAQKESCLRFIKSVESGLLAATAAR